MTPMTREQLRLLVKTRFVDNIERLITPQDGRDIFDAIIDSLTLLLELNKKADLINGKVPLSQLPVPADQIAGIPAWDSEITYQAGKQVTYQDRIWESKINGNKGIPPVGAAGSWREISASHLQNTDTQLLLPDGTPLRAVDILNLLSVVNIPSTLWISPQGDDATAEKARVARPYKTFAAANLAAQPGDMVVVLPGTYNELRVIKDQINYYFHHGAKVVAPDGQQTIDDRWGAIRTYIYGYGEFYGKGSGFQDGNTIVFGNTSQVYMEAVYIESIEVWHPEAKLLIKNAKIDFEFTNYNGGRCRLMDCYLRDSVNVLFGYSETILDRCLIENTIRQHAQYPEIYGVGYYNERSLAITNFWLGSAARLIMRDCTLVSEHENICIAHPEVEITHKNTNMWVNQASNGTVYNGQTVICGSYNTQSQLPRPNPQVAPITAPLPVKFMGTNYFSHAPLDSGVTNAFPGPGYVTVPALSRQDVYEAVPA